MPVIIQDFEIIPEQPPAPQDEQAQPLPPTDQPLRPEEIVRVQRLDAERRRRVRAD